MPIFGLFQESSQICLGLNRTSSSLECNDGCIFRLRVSQAFMGGEETSAVDGGWVELYDGRMQ